MQLLRRNKHLLDILSDDQFWEEVRADIMAVMHPIFLEAFLEGAELATRARPRRRRIKDEFDFDPDFINHAADDVLRAYENEFWTNINRAQQRALREAITRAAAEGLSLDSVIAEIEPLFGPDRARAWAVTETTNMIGEGARATYAAGGYGAWQWRTVGDQRVCRQCMGMAGEQFPITQPFRAAHTSCRCWPDPVL